MAKKKSFPLRIDPRIYDAVEAWAQDEFRSVNGQIEFLLRQSLKKSGRLPQNDQDKKEPQS
ncbi:MAG: Arc family DNA-binding protein [Bacillota bacterium]|jgi:hypothetical protein